jgi:predicted CoA-binding protein
MRYLLDKGYEVIPVNPGLAGQELLGRKVYAALKDIPKPIDMVDIFRNSEAAGGVTDEALALAPPPRVIWMQLGVRNDEAAARAEARGLNVVMNRCPKMEYGKLSGEWAWVGGNSGLISSRRQSLHESGKLQSLGLGPKATSG